MKLVHIEWSDAHHTGAGSWVDPVAVVADVGVAVVTVGFLLAKSKSHVTVCHSLDQSGNATGVFSIPRPCVTKYTVVVRS